MCNIEKFSERLAELLQNNDLTTDELGQKIGVAGSTVRLWTSGRSIFLSNIIKLANYFNCSIDFLLGKTEKPIDFTPNECLPFYSRLRETMKNNEVSTYRICKELKISSSNFTTWKNGTDPFLQTVIILCDYLDITIDVLIGRDR